MKIDLYCFPYAGASTMMYATWRRFLNPCFDLQLIELTGRGVRLDEENDESIEKIGECVFNKLKKRSNPYMLFGHSMGVLIIGEILKNVFQYNYSKPLRVFFREEIRCIIDTKVPPFTMKMILFLKKKYYL